MFRVVLLFLLTDRLIFSSSEEGPTVKTPLGSILGTIQSSRNGIKFYSFRGIRYAKDPTGQLRFKPPVPEEAWTGIMDATADGPDCFSSSPKSANTSDCLRLNVFTRRITEGADNRPVLVYIHGGFFNYGTAHSEILGPDYLMDHDIVLVIVSYRFNLLGFFSTGDKYAPGNYGMKDQVEALRWVKNNIQYFGGDPNKVTIAGKNSGGASVGLHLVSPMSRGLFHGAIMLSGSALSPWVIDNNPMELAKKEAECLGCPTEDSEKMLDCMIKIPVENMTRNFELRKLNEGRHIHSPVIEAESDGAERFLPRDPATSLLKGDIVDVPVFIGTTRYEEISKALGMLRFGDKAKELSQNWTSKIPVICDYKPNDTISNQLREFYFGSIDTPITYESAEKLAELFSDALIIHGVIRSAQLISNKRTKPVYLYQYNHLGQGVQAYLRREMPDKVANSLDLYYIFPSEMFKKKFDAKTKDGQFVTKITTLWKNFMETGNPTPESSEVLDNVIWEPFTNENPKYLDIDETLKMVKGYYFEKRMSLWDSLFPLPVDFVF